MQRAFVKRHMRKMDSTVSGLCMLCGAPTVILPVRKETNLRRGASAQREKPRGRHHTPQRKEAGRGRGRGKKGGRD